MSTDGNRKRSRWGDSTDNDKKFSVSDQEALNALLTSAKSKEQLYKPSSNNDTQASQDLKRYRHDDDRQKRYNQSPQQRNNAKSGGRDDSYYGRPGEHRKASRNDPSSEFERQKSTAGSIPQEPPPQKQKPNFGLSGTLAKEQVGEFKFREPPEARAPNTRWRLYVFKDEKPIETLYISRQSAYLIGRNKDLCDILVLHPSLSGQHAVLQYRALPRKEDGQLNVKPYLMDLESTNGSFINGIKLDPARYYELKRGDVITLGASTREYVLLTETTTSV